VFSVLTFF